jgi:hypothetical protein
LDYSLDDEDSQGTESDPSVASDVFPATVFESGAKIEEESEEKPSQQEHNEADSDPVNGIERDKAEELEQGALSKSMALGLGPWCEDTTEKSNTCDTICFPSMKENQKMNRKNVLRALKNLCTFFGAIALFSYFYNWTVDVRHWYVTLASVLVCSILWLGFYVIEVRGGVMQVALRLSRLRTVPKLPSPTAPPVLPAAPPSSRPKTEVTAANPLPWLNPHPSHAAIAGKDSGRA